MARIQNYDIEGRDDGVITVEDLLLGSDAATGATRNFPIQAIVTFVEEAVRRDEISRSGKLLLH